MNKFLITLILLIISGNLSAQDDSPIALIQKHALVNNPKLKSMHTDVEMMEQRVSQSNALEDPKLKLGVNNVPTGSFSFTKEDMTSKEIGVSQMLPLGKLGTKKAIATKEEEKAKEKYRFERIDVLRMLRMNLYELAYIRSTIKILEEIKGQLKLVIDSQIAANKSGMSSLSNVVKANIEYNMIDEEIISFHQKETESAQQILYLAGSTVDIKISSLPAPEFKEIQIEEIQKAIASSNPELKIYLLDKEISRQEVTLKKEEYIPDVEVGVSYMQRQNGNGMKRDDMVSGMVQFNIPLWSWKKNTSMVNEMKKKNASAENMYNDKTNEINARTEILLSRLVKWRDLYALYHDKLIPQSQLALETILARYKTSAGEFMPVIDTIRMLLRYKKEQNMSLTEYYTAYSELNALMGVEVLQ